jgi:hypothetical protein
VSQTLDCSKHACSWILKNQKYASWFNNDKSSLLWLTAQAGCGKTTMAAHISHMISSHQIPKSDTHTDEATSAVLTFFFRNSTHDTERSASAALRTLINQLARQEPRVLPILLKRHELLSIKGDFEWSWENAFGVLREMLDQRPLDSRIYIILDAIDECLAESQTLILDWVQGIVDECASLVRRPRSPLKVLVTSRPTGDIADQLSSVPTLAIKDTDTQNDVQVLIRDRVGDFARHRRLTPDATQNIAQFLETNAHGMFLWVVLIIKELERRDELLSDSVIASKLSGIPLTLVETYSAILDKSSPSRRLDTWRIFRWMLCSARNLTLTELNKGLCLEMDILNWYDFEGDMKFLCGSLINMGSPEDEVSFIHQTARRFLEALIEDSSTADTGGIAMDFHTANEQLATTCIKYMLNGDLFQELQRLLSPVTIHSTYLDIVRDFIGRYPFLRYVIESWAFHLRGVDEPSSATSNLVRKLLSSQTTRDSIMLLTYFFNKQGSWIVPINQTPLHLAAYFNIPWLVQIYISANPSSVHGTTPMDDTPLIWASEMGSTECVRILLDEGANPNQLEADGWSSLHWAARNGHVYVVTLLLAHGANLHHRDQNGHTPWDWALDRGNLEVAHLFRYWMVKNGSVSQTEDSNPQDLIRGAINERGRLWDRRP